MNKTALFIDCENISSKNLTFILENLKSEELVFTYGYGDFKSPKLKPWYDELCVHNVNAIQQDNYSAGKNASDMAIVIDTIKMCFEKPEINCFALVSSDSDFTPLAKQLTSFGKNVIGFGSSCASRLLVEACTSFVYFNDAPEIEKQNQWKYIKKMVIELYHKHNVDNKPFRCGNFNTILIEEHISYKQFGFNRFHEFISAFGLFELSWNGDNQRYFRMKD